MGNEMKMKEKIFHLLKETDDILSGERISAELGVSRVSVWKHIKKMVGSGIPISSSSKGASGSIGAPSLSLKLSPLPSGSSASAGTVRPPAIVSGMDCPRQLLPPVGRPLTGKCCHSICSSSLEAAGMAIPRVERLRIEETAATNDPGINEREREGAMERARNGRLGEPKPVPD